MHQSQPQPKYKIIAFMRLLRYSIIFSLLISGIALFPLVEGGTLNWGSILTSFGSGLAIGIVAPTSVWLLLHWTMPLAQRRGWSAIRAWSLASLIGGLIGSWMYAFIYGSFFTESHERRNFILFWMVMGAVLAIITTILFYIVERVQNDLERGRLAVQQNAAIAEELRLASMIQNSLLPTTPPTIEGISIAGGCYAAREVGGDLLSYDRGHDQSLFISIGDVTGKSVSAAILMAVSLAVLQAKIQDYHQPAKILQEIDHWLRLKAYKQRFVALQIAQFNPQNLTLTLANAGQLAPILRRGTIPQYLDQSTHLPLGLMIDSAYKQISLQLQHNDVVIFYTDGVVEARNSRGELWGFERFMATIQVIPANAPAQTYVDTIRQTIAEWSNQEYQHDDITLVVMQVTASEV